MIGPILIIALLARAWTGHGKEIPCEPQTCFYEEYAKQAKEDPAPIPAAMKPGDIIGLAADGSLRIVKPEQEAKR